MPEVFTEENPAQVESNIPPFGRCPVCEKTLHPRCKITNQPQEPVVGTGFESRAKCGGCDSILVYLGKKQWRVLMPSDMTEDDHFANRMGF